MQTYFAYTITYQEHLVKRLSGKRIMKDYGLIWPKMSLENTSASVQKTDMTTATAEGKSRKTSERVKAFSLQPKLVTNL